MPAINVKLCGNCMKSLLSGNPYINEYGDPISFKGVKLTRVSPEFCDNHVGSIVKHDRIVLTAMRCNHCSNEYYMRVQKDKKPVCPSCRSSYMTKMSYEELSKAKEIK